MGRHVVPKVRGLSGDAVRDAFGGNTPVEFAVYYITSVQYGVIGACAMGPPPPMALTHETMQSFVIFDWNTKEEYQIAPGGLVALLHYRNHIVVMRPDGRTRYVGVFSHDPPCVRAYYQGGWTNDLLLLPTF
jgi:hypothetical protein